MTHVGECFEAKFAKNLATNEKKIRDRAILKLRKWLTAKVSAKKGFSEDDFVKLWKGLYYCMWMSDKPLIQEECASSIAGLIHCFDSDPDLGILFYKIFLRTDSREWNLLDKWRINKFMMLTRRCLKEALIFLKNHHWQHSLAKDFGDSLYSEIFAPLKDPPCPDDLRRHYTDIFIDELDHVAADEVDMSVLKPMIEPFCLALMHSTRITLVKYVSQNLFEAILNEAQGQQASAQPDPTALKLQFNFEALADFLEEKLKPSECHKAFNRDAVCAIISRYRLFAKEAHQGESSRIRKRKSPKSVGLKAKDYKIALKNLRNLENELKSSSKPVKRKHFREILRDVDDALDDENPKIQKLTIIKKKSNINNQMYKNATNSGCSEGLNCSKNHDMNQSVNKNLDADLSGGDKLSLKSLPADNHKTLNNFRCKTNEPSCRHKLPNGVDVVFKHKATKTMSTRCRSKSSDSKIESNVISIRGKVVKTTAGEMKVTNMDDNHEKKPIELGGRWSVSETGDTNHVERNVSATRQYLKSSENDIHSSTQFAVSSPVIVSGVENLPHFSDSKSDSTASSSSSNDLRKGPSGPSITPIVLPVSKKLHHRIQANLHQTSTPLSSGEKRVSFGMHKNTSIDFEESFSFSPHPPFNPLNTPEQGILKVTSKSPRFTPLRKIKY